METRTHATRLHRKGRVAVARRAAAGAAALLIASAVAAVPASASHTTHSHNNHYHYHSGHYDLWDWYWHETFGSIHLNQWHNDTHNYYYDKSF